jgi:hypothetical protein
MLSLQKIVFLILSLGFLVPALSQEYSQDIWHDGKVILRTGDTLEGELKYDLVENILQYKFGSRIVTLTPKKTYGFFIEDKVLGRNRWFRVFGYNPFSSYKPLLFFEVLVKGKLTLLSRESVYVETIPQFDYFSNTTFYSTRRMVDYSHFFMKKSRKKGGDPEIIQYNDKKKQLLEIMAYKEDQVKDYIKRNKIAYGTREGLILVVNYFNSLFESASDNGK